MSTGLSVFVRKFLLNESAVRQELQHPVLVWEKRSRHQDVQDEFAHLTEIITDFEGALQGKPVEEQPPNPGHDEPLVFVVEKSSRAPGGGAREVTLGRTAQNDLQVPDSSVSRMHAGFLQEAESQEWNLVDRGSSNGTWIGSTRLEPNEPARLPDRSRLRFGSVELHYFSPAAFLEYLRGLAPAAAEEPQGAGAADAAASPSPPQNGARPAQPAGDAERRRGELSLSLRDVDALLDFYRQAMKVFEAYGAKAGGSDALLEKAQEKATAANDVLRRLLVAAKLHDL